MNVRATRVSTRIPQLRISPAQITAGRYKISSRAAARVYSISLNRNERAVRSDSMLLSDHPRFPETGSHIPHFRETYKHPGGSREYTDVRISIRLANSPLHLVCTFRFLRFVFRNRPICPTRQRLDEYEAERSHFARRLFPTRAKLTMPRFSRTFA
jgi:hypothetical protein